MNTYEIGKRYVALVKEGRREECLSTLFSDDAVSVEAPEVPGRERTVKGLDGLRAKSRHAELDVSAADVDDQDLHASPFGPPTDIPKSIPSHRSASGHQNVNWIRVPTGRSSVGRSTK
jgi:hypothetical protein